MRYERVPDVSLNWYDQEMCLCTYFCAFPFFFGGDGCCQGE